MTKEEAISVLNDYDINFERHTAEEVAEAHEMAIKAIFRTIPNENEQIIRISKGTLKARTGRFVVYDVEWLKEHFNTTEVKIYGQSKAEGARGDIPLQQSVPEMPQPKTEQESFEDCIRKSVIVHPKKGHWIGDKGTTVYVNSEGNVTESVNCSECGEWLTGSDEYVCGGRFCPSCGIKMEEKK